MDDHAVQRALDEEQQRLTRAREAAQLALADAQDGRSMDPLADGRLVDREMAASMIVTIDRELEDLEAARQRLEDGRFGRCERCDEPIDDDRLEAVPTTRFCLGHEQEAEVLGDERRLEESRPTYQALLEAGRHLDLVADDDDGIREGDDSITDAEELAIHTRRT